VRDLEVCQDELSHSLVAVRSEGGTHLQRHHLRRRDHGHVLRSAPRRL